jgi:prophage regulatory protein
MSTDFILSKNTIARDLPSEAQDGVLNKSGPRRMLNETQVLEIIPISRTTLFRLGKSGRFPKGTFISPNRRVWFEDEIIAWQDAVDGRGKGRFA